MNGMSTETIKKTRFFAILKDRTFAEFRDFDSIEITKSNIWLLIRDEFKGLKKPVGGFDWRISNYIFLTPDGEVIKYEFNNWRIEEIDINYVSSNRIGFDIVISDPKNRIRRMKDNFNQNRRYEYWDTRDLGIVLQSIEKFHSVSIYSSWEEYDLKIELNNLLKENERLKDEIERYKNDNTTADNKS